MTAYLYRFYDKHDALLYVGVALNFINRVSYHMCAHHNEFNQLTETIKLERFTDRGAALLAEEVAIQTEHPRFNVYRTNGSADRILIEATRR